MKLEDFRSYTHSKSIGITCHALEALRITSDDNSHLKTAIYEPKIVTLFDNSCVSSVSAGPL